MDELLMAKKKKKKNAEDVEYEARLQRRLKILLAELGRVKVNESIEDESDVNEGGEHHIEFLKT